VSHSFLMVVDLKSAHAESALNCDDLVTADFRIVNLCGFLEDIAVLVGFEDEVDPEVGIRDGNIEDSRVAEGSSAESEFDISGSNSDMLNSAVEDEVCAVLSQTSLSGYAIFQFGVHSDLNLGGEFDLEVNLAEGEGSLLVVSFNIRDVNVFEFLLEDIDYGASNISDSVEIEVLLAIGISIVEIVTQDGNFSVQILHVLVVSHVIEDVVEKVEDSVDALDFLVEDTRNFIEMGSGRSEVFSSVVVLAKVEESSTERGPPFLSFVVIV